jgi:ribosomal protein S18 acetylase RimI-like enzyme
MKAGEEREQGKQGGKIKLSPSPLPLCSPAVFRDATDDDIPAIANVIALAFEEHRGKLEPPSSSLDKTPESVSQELQTSNAIVALNDDNIIGCVFYSFKDDFVYLAHLAVLPEYRGLGVARALMLEIEKKALEHNFIIIRLSVRLALEETRAFYEKMGYSFYSYGTHPGFEQLTFVTLEKTL